MSQPKWHKVLYTGADDGAYIDAVYVLAVDENHALQVANDKMLTQAQFDLWPELAKSTQTVSI